MDTDNYKITLRSANGIVTLRLGPLNYKEALEQIDAKFANSSIYKNFEINVISANALTEDEIQNIKKELLDKYKITFKEKLPVKKHAVHIRQSAKPSPLEAISLKRPVSNDIQNISSEPSLESFSFKESDEPAKAKPLKSTPNKTDRMSRIIYGTVRSGTVIKFNGNIIIIGDVNPGAQLVATGDIIVLGSIRGFAYAGYKSSNDAVITAFSISATQLRIGDKIAVLPKEENDVHNTLSTAKVAGDNITVEEKTK